MSALFTLENVTRRYGERVVLDIPSLEVAPGEVLGLCGPNGGGKTTLLRLLALLDAPSAGRILFDGRPVADSVQQVRGQVTLLNQEPYLLKRSVAANVAYGLKIRGCDQVEGATREALSMVGLDHDEFGRRSWFQLSGGERQRVALAARLVLRPRALLLDEPTASLDANSAALVRRAARIAVSDWGAALVVASHDLAWLGKVCSRILTISDGRIAGGPEVAFGVPGEGLARS